ncbi:MAG: hypothetical protein GXX78_10420 [Bacteroidales bacterium]|nr:hypothetical protein [Bacteroidales bacterium]
MKNSTLLILLLIVLSQPLFAQKNTIVAIDGQPITKEEFEIAYRKNNTNLNDVSEVKTPKEYMDMFINFKLKVYEAEKMGMDTTEAFRKELKGYRDELAKTYLTDINITDSMVKEAYYRSVNLVKASHILVEMPERPTPEDTLKAYNKLLDIRKKYLSKEKTFQELAREYSEDPSVVENSGSLPYFGAFKMLTPFENAAFTTPIGEISMPVRSQVGMHLILVEEIIPSAGEVKVGNIMLKYSNNDGNISQKEEEFLKNRIDSLYSLLINGADWGEIAQKYSDDRLAAKNDGIMRTISQEFGVQEFTKAAFALKNDGDISKPVRTMYGYHIIKRFEAKPVPTFEELKPELTRKVKADPNRSKYSKEKFIADRKKEYGFTSNESNFEKFTSIIKSLESDTIYQLPEACKNLVLFTFAGKDYNASNYFQTIMNQYNLDYILRFKFLPGFDTYVEELITNYENERLEEKYPEFKYTIEEYHDGILLFSIMESEVWNKAMADTVGLMNYYNENKEKYKLGEHFDGLLIKCDSEQTRKLVEAAIANGNTNADSLQAIAVAAGGNKNTVVKGRWEPGSNRFVDYFIWKGDKPRDLKEERQFVVGNVKEGGIKTFEEARGLYISEYQNITEEKWMKSLREKYPVQVNEKLLKKVKSLKK